MAWNCPSLVQQELKIYIDDTRNEMTYKERVPEKYYKTWVRSEVLKILKELESLERNSRCYDLVRRDECSAACRRVCNRTIDQNNNVILQPDQIRKDLIKSISPVVCVSNLSIAAPSPKIPIPSSPTEDFYSSSFFNVDANDDVIHPSG